MAIISGTDHDVEQRIRDDIAAYTAAMQRDDVDACIVIEKRYGLFGLPPQQVHETLSEMLTA